MDRAIEFALAHGWSDEAVAELERLLTDMKMEAALTLIRAQDMTPPERQDLMALVVLQIVS
jgi:flavorubredoxin